MITRLLFPNLVAPGYAWTKNENFKGVYSIILYHHMSKGIWNARLSKQVHLRIWIHYSSSFSWSLISVNGLIKLGKKSREIVPWECFYKMTPEGKLAVGKDLTVPCQHIYHLSGGCRGYLLCMMEDRKERANFDGEEQITRRRARME